MLTGQWPSNFNELHVMERLKARSVKQLAQTHERLVLEMRLGNRSLKKIIGVKFTKRKIKHFIVNNSVTVLNIMQTLLFTSKTFSLSQKEITYPVSNHPLMFPSPKPLATSNLISVSMD